MRFYIQPLIFGLSLLLSASSCNNFLDIHPKGEMLSKELLKDRKGFENALYGVYATLRNENLYGKNMSFYAMDLLAQYFESQRNTIAVGLNHYDYYQNKDVREKIFLNIWSKMYESISYTNNILKNLEQQTPQSLQFYNLYKGEALGLRAYMHFDLLRIFCPQSNGTGTPGIVYNTDFSLTPPDLLPKARIWELIVQDLEEAEKLLDSPELYAQANGNDTYLKDPQIHFNLHAVRATLARVYLTQEDYDKALVYARKVIDQSGLELIGKEKLADAIGCLTKEETIFGLYDPNDWYNHTKDLLYDNNLYRSLTPHKKIAGHYNTGEEGHDFRWDAWFKPISNQQRLVKLTDTYHISSQAYPDNLIPGINLLKLPEMYYIAAECLLRKNDPEAGAYFKAVLSSRGLVPAKTLSLQEITDERYREFIGEGQTFFNMKRLNLDIENVDGETVPASEEIYTVRIPDEEFSYRK